jgi:DNA-directed RNA polymerase specialized sigma24 family protein
VRDKKFLYRRFNVEGQATLKKAQERPPRWEPVTDPWRISLALVRKRLAGSKIDTALWDDVVQDGLAAYCAAEEAGRLRAENGEASITAFIEKTIENKCIDAIHGQRTE